MKVHHCFKVPRTVVIKFDEHSHYPLIVEATCEREADEFLVRLCDEITRRFEFRRGLSRSKNEGGS